LKWETYQLVYDVEESYWWYAARRNIIMAQIESALGATPSTGPARILDYGCGTGLNLVRFAQLGRAYGVDSSERALEFCRKRGLDNVKQISEESAGTMASPFDQSFDIITLLDVLEHISDDAGRLKTIGGWLSPGGQILITVPAFPWLWGGEDIISNHLRRYTRRTLREAVERAGFEVNRLSYFNFFLFPLQAITIFARRLFRLKSLEKTSVVPLPKPANQLLTAIMSAEAAILKHGTLPFGGSLLCWCRPRRA
jgi:SAM-dependent methyltransferase